VTWRAAVLAAAVLAAGAILSFRPIYEPDLWWHLAQGRETAEGRLVRTNVFSFTHPDYRQHFTPWLYDVGLYGAWQAFGPAGIQLVQAGCLSLTFWLLFAAGRIRAPAWSVAAALLIGFVILEPRAIPRPHLVSFAGMAACVLLVERAAAARSAAPLRAAIPLVALWSNLHVECVFGVLLLGVFSLSEHLRPASLPRAEARRALAWTCLAALATLANPYGWGLWAYLYENAAVPQLMAIAELRPPYLPEYRAFYAYAGICAILLLSQWRSLTAWETAVAVIFAVLGARYLRLTPLLLLATAPMVAARLARLADRGVDRRAVLITAACAAFVLSRVPPRLLVTELAAGREAVEPPQFFSPAAIAFIEGAELEGPVFNSHNLGGYLAWTMYPRVRIFQDSRLQAYPPEHFRAIIAASREQALWEALTADVGWAVLSVPRPNQLSGHGRFAEPEWRTVYRDGAIEVVIRRRTGSTSNLQPPTSKELPTSNFQRTSTSDVQRIPSVEPPERLDVGS